MTTSAIGTEFNIKFRKNEDTIFKTRTGVVVADSEGDPLDLTTLTEIVFLARKDRSDANAIDIDLASEQWTLGAGGTFSLDITADDMAVPTGRYTYQVVATDVTGDVSTLYYGVLDILGTLTP